MANGNVRGGSVLPCGVSDSPLPEAWKGRLWNHISDYARILQHLRNGSSSSGRGRLTPPMHYCRKTHTLTINDFSKSNIWRKFSHFTPWHIATDSNTFAHPLINAFALSRWWNGWCEERGSQAADNCCMASMSSICRKNERYMIRILSRLVYVSSANAYSASAT